MTRRYDAVLFDLDGTLIDSWEALHDAVNEALHSAERGPVSRDVVIASVGDGIEALLERCLGHQAPESVLDVFVSRYDQVCCEKSRALDGVEPTLEALAAGGIMMAVCTNKPTGFSTKIIEALGLGRFFEEIVGPDVAGARKPDPRHVLHAARRTSSDPSRILFVGDMPVDVEAAVAAGLDVATIATGSASAESLHSMGANYNLGRFEDLVSIVLGERSAA